MFYLDDMDALRSMLRGCFFGMNPFDDTADTQYIFRYHGCYVNFRSLILQKPSKLIPQHNRWIKKPYEGELWASFSNKVVLNPLWQSKNHQP